MSLLEVKADTRALSTHCFFLAITDAVLKRMEYNTLYMQESVRRDGLYSCGSHKTVLNLKLPF